MQTEVCEAHFHYISLKTQQVQQSGAIWVFVYPVKYTVTGSDSLFTSQSAV